jgi:hypothetical protein
MRWVSWLSAIGAGWVALAGACGGGDAETSGGDGGSGGFITGAGGSTTTGSAVGGTQTTTSTGGTTTSTGGGGTTSSTGSGGMGGSFDCVDIGLGEPNESEATAWGLQPSAIEDCDGDGDSITGVLGPGDVDWFVYEGDDTILCVVDPTRTLSQSQGGARLCKYFECINGNTDFSCPSGTTDDTSPGGRAGCCGTGGFDVDDLNCTGSLDEHAFVYIRLDQPAGGADTCNDYTLAYHY